jgi:hypothetical protein
MRRWRRKKSRSTSTSPHLERERERTLEQIRYTNKRMYESEIDICSSMSLLHSTCLMSNRINHTYVLYNNHFITT